MHEVLRLQLIIKYHLESAVFYGIKPHLEDETTFDLLYDNFPVDTVAISMFKAVVEHDGPIADLVASDIIAQSATSKYQSPTHWIQWARRRVGNTDLLNSYIGPINWDKDSEWEIYAKLRNNLPTVVHTIPEWELWWKILNTHHHKFPTLTTYGARFLAKNKPSRAPIPLAAAAFRSILVQAGLISKEK